MKTKLSILLMCAALLLSGCSFGTFSVDTLLTPPKLSQEQQEIHQCLIESVGNDITLKYPSSGDNRSAFVVANIDSEPTEEAIVFYEYSDLLKSSAGIRINVLDKNGNNKWKSQYDFEGPGTDIDKIVITNTSKNDDISIIIGYSTLNMTDKILEVYNYKDGMLNLIGRDTYSVLETIDLDNNGYNEIVTVQSGVEGSNATASLISVNESQLVKSNITEMGVVSSSVTRFIKGKAMPSHKALFLDCKNPDGSIHTEFLYFRYNSLQNPVAQIGDKLIQQTTRPDGYYSTDVDGDGVIEIPTVTVLPGYELLSSDKQLYLTTWSVYEDFYKLEDRMSGYYSINMGFMLAFPDSWKNKVTVKRDEITGEVVFYEFSETLENSVNELARIAVCPKSDAEEYIDNGYKVITAVGQVDYLVKLADEGSNELATNLQTIRRNFYVVSK